MKPWEQQPGEPAEAYVRFLEYRNLGPARSIDAAYAVSNKIAPNRAKPRRASGQWDADSATYRWVERAAAWDIETFSTIGQQAVIKFIAAIDKFAEKTLAAMESTEPRNWSDILDTIELLSRLIPSETVEALVKRAKADSSNMQGDH